MSLTQTSASVARRETLVIALMTPNTCQVFMGEFRQTKGPSVGDLLEERGGVDRPLAMELARSRSDGRAIELVPRIDTHVTEDEVVASHKVLTLPTIGRHASAHALNKDKFDKTCSTSRRSIRCGLVPRNSGSAVS